jgi:hypothetical protein
MVSGRRSNHTTRRPDRIEYTHALTGGLLRFGRALLDAATRAQEGWFAPAAGREDLARYDSLDVVVAFIERRLGG